jgi:hypothetical protein
MAGSCNSSCVSDVSTSADADDADALAAELERAAARDHVHAGLRRAVGHVALARLLRVDRRDVDDDAAAALVEHLAGAVLDPVEDAAERHRMHQLPLLVRQLRERRDGAHPRAVDHDVERPEGGARRAHRPFDLALVRDVHDAADRTFAEPVGGGLDRVGLDVAQQRVGAGLDECGRDRVADARCGAGDDRAPSIQRLHLQSP